MYRLQEEINYKMKFNKCAYLLSMGTIDAREEFIIEFLPKIEKFTDKMYTIYQEELNGIYDYEDYFCDTVMLAIKIYDSRKFNKDGYSNLNNYIRYLMYQSTQFIKNTYAVKKSKVSGVLAVKVLKKYRDFVQEEGRNPSISELERITNVSKQKLLNIIHFENFDDLKIGIPSFENDLIDSLVYEDLKEDLSKALDGLSEEERELICSINGYNREMISQSDYARKTGIARQNVHKKLSKVYKKMRENNSWLESYRG